MGEPWAEAWISELGVHPLPSEVTAAGPAAHSPTSPSSCLCEAGVQSPCTCSPAVCVTCPQSPCHPPLWREQPHSGCLEEVAQWLCSNRLELSSGGDRTGFRAAATRPCLQARQWLLSMAGTLQGTWKGQLVRGGQVWAGQARLAAHPAVARGPGGGGGRERAGIRGKIWYTVRAAPRLALGGAGLHGGRRCWSQGWAP